MDENLVLGTYYPGVGAYLGSRPDWLPPQLADRAVDEITLVCNVMTGRGLMVNSQLRDDEWQTLDAAVQMAALQRLNGVAHLRAAGLVNRIGSIGTLTSQWNQASEMTAADVSMSGQGQGDRGRIEFALAGRPVPIISKDFTIPVRQLEAGRLLGNALDTSHASAAARVVVEKAEQLLFNGDSSTIFEGNTIYGYTTEPNRSTDTATNYGGGDWGTVTNVVPTVAGMISAANGKNYYGPFNVYASTTQYAQATTAFFTDGSGNTPAVRLRELPQINDIYPGDWLADGVVVLVQMTQDVVDWSEHLDVTVVEWMSGDGLVGHYKVMMVATPRVKSDFNSNSGVVHATAA